MGVTKSEILLAKLNTLFRRINPIHAFSLVYDYYRTYENYKDVLLNVLREKYPFQAKLRDGRVVEINNNNRGVVYFYTVYLTKLHITRLEDDIIEFIFDNKKVVFYDWDKGDLADSFAYRVYNFLDVTNKTVVDVGAGIADTAIYFALRGAKRVIAFEPFPKIFDIAQRNVKANGLEDKVILVNAGCGYDGEVRVKEDVESNASAGLRDFGEGVKIPMYSLNTIVSKFNVEKGSVLKVDCEGCEYDLFRNASREALDRFDQIEMEYHYGYKELVNILKKNGFKTKNTIPKYRYRTGRILGYIYAWRQ
ncbi:MAG: FkbM family methyltransferase [Sulfolobales archaeon]|nr:FkbM family methyltransferase [Sulfolobales archaeon]